MHRGVFDDFFLHLRPQTVIDLFASFSMSGPVKVNIVPLLLNERFHEISE